MGFVKRFNHNQKPHIYHAQPRRKLEDMKLGELEQILDREVSFYVRMTFADESGNYVSCITCGAIYPVKEMDCGHFISRVYRGTRWELMNLGPQCTKCNCYEEGQHDTFRRRLVEKYGEEAVKNLEAKKDFYGHTKMPREWLIEQIHEFRKLNKKIRDRIGRTL